MNITCCTSCIVHISDTWGLAALLVSQRVNDDLQTKTALFRTTIQRQIVSYLINILRQENYFVTSELKFNNLCSEYPLFSLTHARRWRCVRMPMSDGGITEVVPRLNNALSSRSSSTCEIFFQYTPGAVFQSLVTVLSRLDYCNSVLVCLPQHLTYRFRSVQNAAASHTFRIRSSERTHYRHPLCPLASHLVQSRRSDRSTELITAAHCSPKSDLTCRRVSLASPTYTEDSGPQLATKLFVPSFRLDTVGICRCLPLE